MTSFLRTRSGIFGSTTHGIIKQYMHPSRTFVSLCLGCSARHQLCSLRRGNIALNGSGRRFLPHPRRKQRSRGG